MNRPSLAVLDVGHGNCAVLFDSKGTTVIDGGKSGVLIDFLRQLKIRVVHSLLISHSDEDHILNATDLLLDQKISVYSVYYNSDSSQQSVAWQCFRKAVKEARRNKHTLAEPQLTTSQTGRLKRGSIEIEVLFPFPETAGSGPGGTDEEGTAITSNSMSAVIRLSKSGEKMVMLAGDVERGCLAAWAEEQVDPNASILVFPHHGGNPGKHDRVKFATELVQAVKPTMVVFSIHRSRFGLPKSDVVDAVRAAAPGVRIACTQLSTQCAANVPSQPANI
jgi:competence protein ComEC